jgi:hypothetical protein
VPCDDQKDVPEQALEGTEILQEFNKKLFLKWAIQENINNFLGSKIIILPF